MNTKQKLLAVQVEEEKVARELDQVAQEYQVRSQMADVSFKVMKKLQDRRARLELQRFFLENLAKVPGLG